MLFFSKIISRGSLYSTYPFSPPLCISENNPPYNNCYKSWSVIISFFNKQNNQYKRNLLEAVSPLDLVISQSLENLIAGLGRCQKTEAPVDGPEQGVGLVRLAEGSLEVVQVQGPDHGAAKTLVLEEVDLQFDGVQIVEAHPLWKILFRLGLRKKRYFCRNVLESVITKGKSFYEFVFWNLRAFLCYLNFNFFKEYFVLHLIT